METPSRAGEQGWGKVALPRGWQTVPLGVGAAADLQFNNGNLHFTNERINSREMVFLATVALLQRRRFHLKPGKPPTKSACLQGVISIIRARGEAWLHSEAGVPTLEDTFSWNSTEKKVLSMERSPCLQSEPESCLTPTVWVLWVRWGHTGWGLSLQTTTAMHGQAAFPATIYITLPPATTFFQRSVQKVLGLPFQMPLLRGRTEPSQG